MRRSRHQPALTENKLKPSGTSVEVFPILTTFSRSPWRGHAIHCETSLAAYCTPTPLGGPQAHRQQTLRVGASRVSRALASRPEVQGCAKERVQPRWGERWGQASPFLHHRARRWSDAADAIPQAVALFRWEKVPDSTFGAEWEPLPEGLDVAGLDCMTSNKLFRVGISNIPADLRNAVLSRGCGHWIAVIPPASRRLGRRLRTALTRSWTRRSMRASRVRSMPMALGHRVPMRPVPRARLRRIVRVLGAVLMLWQARRCIQPMLSPRASYTRFAMQSMLSPGASTSLSWGIVGDRRCRDARSSAPSRHWGGGGARCPLPSSPSAIEYA